MTQNEIEKTFLAIAKGFKSQGDQLIVLAKELKKQKAALQGLATEVGKRLKDLKAGRMEYVGTFDHAKSYQRGQCVTHDGSMWHCEEASTMDVPGRSAAWRLAVKRGRDAR